MLLLLSKVFCQCLPLLIDSIVEFFHILAGLLVWFLVWLFSQLGGAEIINSNCAFVDFSFQFYLFFTHFSVLFFGLAHRIAMSS